MDEGHAVKRRLISLARDCWSGLLDLVYPTYCLVCEQESEDYLCAKCIESIDTISPPVCRKCGIPTEEYMCFECRERNYVFTMARSAAIYDGSLRNAIHLFKYSRRIVLADPLAQLMIRCLPDTRLVGKFDIVVPIPIHPSRMRERGFNQAEELARRLCEAINIPMNTQVLYKLKKTRHQANLPEDERLINLQGSFAVRNADMIRGRRVLIVDDVMTTGSTLNEAAQVLLSAGAGEVYGYTLARSL